MPWKHALTRTVNSNFLSKILVERPCTNVQDGIYTRTPCIPACTPFKHVRCHMFVTMVYGFTHTHTLSHNTIYLLVHHIHDTYATHTFAYLHIPAGWKPFSSSSIFNFKLPLSHLIGFGRERVVGKSFYMAPEVCIPESPLSSTLLPFFNRLVNHYIYYMS